MYKQKEYEVRRILENADTFSSTFENYVDEVNSFIDRIFDNYIKAREEKTKLHNIINELERWLEEQIKICQAHDNQLGVNVCNTLKYKLKELKGESSNE